MTVQSQEFRSAPALVTLLTAAILTACAGRAQPGVVEPGVEQEAIEGTRPHAPRLLVFDWSLRDGASRFSGSGAARIAPAPPRARLDLFGPQDEGYLSAVLRGGTLFVPDGVPDDLVPPAPLLWSALGVVMPPAGARLLTATRRDGRVELVYGDESGDWRYVLRDGTLRSAEWTARDGGRHTVERSAAEGAPVRSRYRDWQEYRELVLELAREEEVTGFPSDIWEIDAMR